MLASSSATSVGVFQFSQAGTANWGCTCYGGRSQVGDFAEIAEEAGQAQHQSYYSGLNYTDYFRIITVRVLEVLGQDSLLR